MSLPFSLSNYSARECDCDFCQSRHIGYLSDPNGQLDIVSTDIVSTDIVSTDIVSTDIVSTDIVSAVPFKIFHQGSNQATFLACANCNEVVAVSFLSKKGLIGAVNASLLSEQHMLKKSTKVSPRLLTPTDKIKRWQEMWCPMSVNGKAEI